MITAIASYAYGVFPTGQRQMAAEGTGRTSVYSYDALWRLQGESITGDQHARNGALGYGYDPVGNRKARTSTVTGLAAQSFTYNSDDRVNGDTYDLNGNTVVGSASQPASAYAAGTGVAAPPPAIPTGATSSASTPDTSKPILGNDTYDSFDRLVKRTGATGSVQITYNGDGEKVAETITQAGLTVTTTYLVDELNPTGYSQVLEESTNGSLSRVYTFGLELISQDEVLSTSGSQISWTATYYGYDGHGNVRFLTNGAGAVTDTYDFDAFGNLLNVTSGSGSGGSTSATPNLHLYCGEQYDSAIGQYYLRARVMNPLTGRFWTMDTFSGITEDPGSLHKYSYCEQFPVAFSDASGHSILLTVCIAIPLVVVLDVVATTVYDHVTHPEYYDSVRNLKDDTSLRFEQFAEPDDVQASVRGDYEAFAMGVASGGDHGLGTSGPSACREYFVSPRPRYAFSRKLGWIDLQHVAAATWETRHWGWAQMYAGGIFGLGNEASQWLKGHICALTLFTSSPES